MEHCTIAIPGENTTAAFLLNYALPRAKKRKAFLFSSIEEAVLSGEADLGVIIHENRFTYQQKGLVKVLDLGEYWEQKTGMPIPLGCISVKRSIDAAIQKNLDQLIRQSIVYAFQHHPQISEYVKMHAQAMDEVVMRQHIELYVNDFSIDLGEEGRAAIKELYNAYCLQLRPGSVPEPQNLFFE
jgi:1,4-dihydroxy-6-naphthoate synthase